MNDQLKQRLVISIVVIVNIICWMIPSRIDYLVAQQRDILLTRYSIGYFTVLLVLLIISSAVIYIFSGKQQKRKERTFAVISVFVGLIIGSVVIDMAARMIKTARYVKTDDVYHRPPNQEIKEIFKDDPITAYSYPFTPKGYTDVPYTLTVDEFGFRNKKKHDQCDILTLGDSFTEGSSVSDDQSWPALIEANTGKPLYNLGMSGGSPSTYVETFQKYGLKRSPETVFCMIYEGNDFKGSGELVTRVKKRSTLKERIRYYRKTFFILYSLKDMFKKYLAISNRNYDKPPDEDSIFSWIPVKIPQSGDSKYYTFRLKKVIKHFIDREKFKNSKGCRTAVLAIQKLSDLCKDNNIDFYVVYASEKSHVVMPLIKDHLDAGKFKQYLEMKMDDLPSAIETKETFYANAESKEIVIREYCEQNSIKFISTTKVLRDEILTGNQAFFTYDQHWSPKGHKTVADLLLKETGLLIQ